MGVPMRGQRTLLLELLLASVSARAVALVLGAARLNKLRGARTKRLQNFEN